MDLFDYMRDNRMKKESPLAAGLAQTLEEVVAAAYNRKGQALIPCHKGRQAGLNHILRTSWGKTTLARVIANTTSSLFVQINATVSGKKDMEDVLAEAKKNLGMYGKRTILFIDEIHRFNKASRITFCLCGDGTVILIGATTETLISRLILRWCPDPLYSSSSP